ncbi:hypothetical protein ASPZODRAFT_137267 [Penicilliopsis zonata CBS 506.65]|uniref:Major facilitator superfamily (MFS) profile domain-containing protein n=1 Tax=Penicilliopsis zonata CBS 506.65 TaxID=1073090 RepID=A0A1L9S5M6_9EURO|nr:hypothetical protein ASPZODRAFT_137267 [Penicilliopsis zonata CBS 506.65]OJJ42455.1 hypothetical protein ASPZODRAFT_137267 [Penicilliopsis zonata CBS 506.65]
MAQEKDKDTATQLEERLFAAQQSTEAEVKMSLWQALKLYPKASLWSILISFAVVMEGYDVILMGSFYAYPNFTKRFGVKDAAGDYEIPAHWQASLGNSGSVGQIIGLMFNEWAAERYGYRIVMSGALIATMGFIFLFFFATNLEMLLAAEILCGIPWGIFQTLTTSYACEVAPVALRAYLTTWVNACWGIGQLLSCGVLRALLYRTDQWGWRIPFAVQWVWPIPLLIITLLAPESPWWLVRHGHYERAKQSLQRLTDASSVEGFNIDNTIQMMIHTDELEREERTGSRYIDCFRGIELRRTEIVCMVWTVQNMCGSAFMSYSTYFFEQAGLPDSDSYDLSMGQYAINTAGTFAVWGLLMLGISRRGMYLWGCVFMGIALIIIGCVSLDDAKAGSWAVGAMLLAWNVGYQFSVGTIAFSLVTELSSRRLMVKALNIGRAVYNVEGLILGVLTPYMLNPTAWNWGGKTAFFWAGFDALCVVWIYFRLPDPTGMTFAEIDKRFEMKIPARQFKSVQVDEFEGERQQLEKARATENP